MYDQASETDRQGAATAARHAAQPGVLLGPISGAPLRGAGRAGGLLALQQAASTGRLFADAGGIHCGQRPAWGPARPLAVVLARVPAQPGLCRSSPPGKLRAALLLVTWHAALQQPALVHRCRAGECGPVIWLCITRTAGGAAHIPCVARVGHPKIPGCRGRPAARTIRPAPVVQSVQRLWRVVPRPWLHLAPTPPPTGPTLPAMALFTFDYAGHRGWCQAGAQAMLPPLNGAMAPR